MENTHMFEYRRPVVSDDDLSSGGLDLRYNVSTGHGQGKDYVRNAPSCPSLSAQETFVGRRSRLACRDL